VKPPAAHKVTKAKAQYGKGMDSAHCGICTHFRPPTSCVVVIGAVGARGWCKYFEKKQ